MKLSDFDYFLPEELIAQTPIEPRDNSRLLVLNPKTKSIKEKRFYEILDLLWENDVLVLNETKVIKARLEWEIEIYPDNKKEKQIKKIEIFLHKQISLDTWECFGPWNNLKIWRVINFFDKKGNKELEWKIEKISPMWRFIKFNKSSIELSNSIEKIWTIPLPHYIHKELQDFNRYQTIFSKIEWSVASPTAGLHFTKELLEKLEKKWVKIEKVLLHVWVWTFKPVEVEDITNHYMHYEYIEINQNTANNLNNYKSQGKRIIAVWTTSVRTIESFSDANCHINHWSQDTNIFIYPWYEWKFIDAIITNFHLPKSTLLMLISSFWWLEFIKKAYNYAIKNKFRFFSFWDAMFIENKK